MVSWPQIAVQATEFSMVSLATLPSDANMAAQRLGFLVTLSDNVGHGRQSLQSQVTAEP